MTNERPPVVYEVARDPDTVADQVQLLAGGPKDEGNEIVRASCGQRIRARESFPCSLSPDPYPLPFRKTNRTSEPGLPRKQIVRLGCMGGGTSVFRQKDWRLRDWVIERSGD
jgi:hypothetical protein